MKAIAYEPEKLDKAAQLLDSLPIKGIPFARIMAEIGDILDSGIPVEIEDKKENPKDKNKKIEEKKENL